MSADLLQYLGLSYRRKRIDADLTRVSGHLAGRVLTGGRAVAARSAPAGARWVVADVSVTRTAGNRLGVGADIQALPFRAGAFDAVKATEVLEHVPDVRRALVECRRVLRPGGHLVITVPFLERVHGDPDDYARFTRSMWERLLAEAGLRPTTIAPQGGYFSHLAGLLRYLVLHSPRPLRWAGYATFPLLDGLAWLDGLARVRRSELATWVGGYLIVATHP
jgi:SAM-dependent methyltransferase